MPQNESSLCGVLTNRPSNNIDNQSLFVLMVGRIVRALFLFKE